MERLPAPVDSIRRFALTASLYGRSSVRLLRRGGVGRLDERLVFVVGSPRSGTTFVAEAIGGQPGFVDLGEVLPLKAAIPELVAAPTEEAARGLRSILERVRLLGLARAARAVEQTPEMAFLLPAVRRAYPRAGIVHVIRDGRDVVCSLLERGWLSADHAGRDDARQRYGTHARFWVEPERRDEFPRVSDASRAAWMWRRYVTAAQAVDGAFELRYEALVADPGDISKRLARYLDSDPAPLAKSLARAHARSLGRWHSELSTGQVADVEREAGELLAQLGYV
jgi:Sulfotransferase family